MISEERVKLMTRMASFEDNEGRKSASIARHFRSDYVWLQVLKAVICASLACMIVFGVYVYTDFEGFILELYKMDDIWEYAKGILKYYLIFVLSYSVIVYIVFSFRYGKSRNNLKRYFNNLKLLNSLYIKEEGESK